MNVEIDPAQLALALLSMLLLTMLLGMLVAWGWLFWRLATGQALLPSQPLVSLSPPVWRGGTLILVIATYFLVNFLVTGLYLGSEGRLPRKRPATSKVTLSRKNENQSAKAKDAASAVHEGAERPVAPRDVGPQPATKKPDARTHAENPSRVERHADKDSRLSWTEQMFLISVMNALLIIVVPFLVRRTSGARLRDLGLSFRGSAMQLAVGVVATLAATPLVYSIQVGAIRFWQPRQHELQKMLTEEPLGWGIASLAIVSAVILAPIFEELMFRGLVQRWCIDFFTRRLTTPKLATGRLTSAGQMTVADSLGRDMAANGVAMPPTDQDRLERVFDAELDSSHVKAAETPVSRGLQVSSRTSAGLGIGFTSLVFGAIHFDQWPAPIPLFALAMVIGFVYYRTGSLIAAIIMHATFNGFSTLGLFVAILVGQGKEANKVLEGHSPVPSVITARGWDSWAPLLPQGAPENRECRTSFR
jgi:membrane protease YdiL (CAAX protease family)